MRKHVVGEQYPIEPPVLRATLIKAEAMSVLLRGIPAKEAVRIGMKTNGRPMLSSMRETAKNQKSTSPFDSGHVEHRQRADCRADGNQDARLHASGEPSRDRHHERKHDPAR